MQSLRDTIEVSLTNAIPERNDSPWILQIYVQDEFSIDSYLDSIEDYPKSSIRASAYTQTYNKIFREHFGDLASASVARHSSTDSSPPVKIRRVRAVLFNRSQKTTNRVFDQLYTELTQVIAQFQASLHNAGLQSQLCDRNHVFAWLVQWFNPKPDLCSGDSRRLAALLTEEDDAPHLLGWELSEQINLSRPRSDESSGTWWFDELPHEIVSVQQLRRVPFIGHFTTERNVGDQQFALFDRFPEGSVLCITICVEPQEGLLDRIARIKRASVGDSAEAQITKEQAIRTEHCVAQGNKLFSVFMAIYLRGNDLPDLYAKQRELHATLLAHGVQPITHKSDRAKLDAYIRCLPMNYDRHLDKTTRRSRLMFSKHVTNLLPVFGRARGTGRPGFTFFNRGMEPLDFDPLNAEDRKKNGHMLILGPTGAGKSALLVYLLQQMMAKHRPRLFIIEAGGSFELLGKHFAENGLSVNRLNLQSDTDVSIPPFRQASRLDERGHQESARDILGEMEIISRVMISGGDSREAERMSRSDQLAVREAIVRAGVEANQSDVLTEDIVFQLRKTALNPALTPNRRDRIDEIANSMALYCSGVAGRLFNRAGNPWPNVDVTIFEMGLLAREGYEDQLTIAYLSLMGHINDLVERHQNDTRATLVVTDEGHIITTHPLLASYVVKITKMWRKWGAWFWIATQNLADFPEASQRMLNMIEWWLCLVLPKEEIEQVSRFRDLSTTQKQLLLNTRKEPGKYVEGVVLSDSLETMFRNVPPAISLALAMTEKHEKAQRRQIMNERGCSEYEAALHVARHLVR